MFPLSIKVNDFLIAGFAANSNKTPQLITGVSGPTTVNNMKSYQVTAGGVTYTCTEANTTVQEKTINVPSGTTTGFVTTWVLGA